MAIKIESGIPMPTDSIGSKSSLISDLRELSRASIGDSAFFPKPADIPDVKKWRNRISSSITHVGTGWASYALRSETIEEGGQLLEGVRVWKKADVVDK